MIFIPPFRDELCLFTVEMASKPRHVYKNCEKVRAKKAKKIIQLAGVKTKDPTHASPGGSPGLSTENSRQFLVIEKNKVHELRCDSAEMHVHWLNLLNLLTLFPYSIIPEEPQLNPFSEFFRAKLDPKSTKMVPKSSYNFD